MDVARILFPTDFSEASGEALERAVALALRTGAILRVFHVELPHELDSGRLASGRGAVLDQIAGLRERWKNGVGRHAEFEFESARSVSAYGGIMEEIGSFAPDIVMMATHGGGLLMGSVAERVVRDAKCNVLTCRSRAQGNWPLMPGRILVPVDFSDNSKRALQAARSVADGSPITLVHVVDTPRASGPYSDAVPSPFEADPQLRARIEAHLQEWAGEPVDAVSAVEGEVRTTLLDECRRLAAVLVVVGTHGVHSPSQWTIGSTAERLTRSCVAPVLNVR